MAHRFTIEPQSVQETMLIPLWERGSKALRRREAAESERVEGSMVMKSLIDTVSVAKSVNDLVKKDIFNTCPGGNGDSL